MEFTHKSVLLRESIEALHIDPDGVYCDATAGGGGHSFEVARHLQNGRLIAVDRDPDAIAAARERLKDYASKTVFVQSEFSRLKEILNQQHADGLNGLLLDLGVSSYQFDTPERGFSYNYDAPLDMRMSKSGMTAGEYLNTESREGLVRTLREYGEEKFASSIAQAVLREREKKPIATTFELVDIIKSAIPAAARRQGGHPAKRTFQALRIKINGELEELSGVLDDALTLLKPGGRIAVITFHSLEDRMVKQRFADWAQGCVCPPDFPVCVCGRKPLVKLINKKGVTPSPEELAENPRSHSARLRTAEKI